MVLAVAAQESSDDTLLSQLTEAARVYENFLTGGGAGGKFLALHRNNVRNSYTVN